MQSTAWTVVKGAATVAAMGMAGVAAAQDAAPTLSAGDTAWMLVATALVLLMTLPGLALFYAGMVRAKNVLSVLMQCFAIAGLITVLWVVYGYSLAFDTTGMVEGEINLASFIGGFDKVFLAGATRDSLVLAIPESLFVAFQMTFAIITPALIVGAFAERMRFAALLVFTALWFTFAYLPIAHMTWAGPGGLFWDWGVLDFAGGTVVHINAGIAGLVAAIVIGKRKGWPTTAMAPHHLGYTLIGAGLLWVGWFGFNAGSAVAANGGAGLALLVTQIAAATAALGWIAAEWVTHGKPSVLGIASGVIAGLVAITPAAGTAGPMGALAIGAISGVLCFFAATKLKRIFGYDDSLDVFGVHGVGGIIGALLTGVFASAAFGGAGLPGDRSIGEQVFWQAAAVGITVVWSAVVTVITLKIAGLFGGLRATPDEEQEGLDLALHGENGYNL
ncbi:MAG: ammonium transporter [Lysobacteraceae bacterium]